MPRPIRGAKGRFHGSVGDGGKNTPTTPPPAAPQPAAAGDDAAVPPLLGPPVSDGDLAADPHTNPDMLRRLAEVFPNTVAANPNTDAAALERLADSRDEGVLARVASHPNVSVHTLRRITGDHPDSLPVLRAVGANPHCPTDLLDRLAGHRVEFVRSVVAANPATSTQTLARLGRDSDGGVRELVAENLNTDPDTLDFMARDTDCGPSPHYMAQAVARHPNVTVDTVLFLVHGHPYAVIRRGMATHHLAVAASEEQHTEAALRYFGNPVWSPGD